MINAWKIDYSPVHNGPCIRISVYLNRGEDAFERIPGKVDGLFIDLNHIDPEKYLDLLGIELT